MAHAVCLWQAHCVNNSEKNTQGVRQRRPVGKTPCYKKWIATPLARNDNFNCIHAFSYALKNKFAILNLVRTFFNFDNLFGKKKPNFVINKKFFQGDTQ